MTTIDNKVSNVSLSKYTYSYDALGRRDDRQQSGSAITAMSTDDFAYNARSEVISSTNSIETAAQWNPTYTFDQIGNRKSSTGLQTVSTYTTNAVNQYTAIDAVNSTHDLDGNLLSNSTWTYSWNNENRLSSATDGSVTIDFVYDYQGRLVKKDDGTDIEVYVYDGWNRIATFVLQTSNLTLQTSYTWGLELSGSLQGAGGVGGLLKEGAYYPLFDANGNVMQKLDGAGATVMNVDYDPFGNIISGTLVGEYGFSTKPLIDDLDWYYYGFRYYDPVTGRWPSRDPIEERGSMLVQANIEASSDIRAYLLGAEFTRRSVVALHASNDLRGMKFADAASMQTAVVSYVVAARDLANVIKIIQRYEESIGYSVIGKEGFLLYPFVRNNGLNQIDKLGMMIGWPGVVGTGLTAAAGMVALGVGGVSAPLWVPIAMAGAGVALIACEFMSAPEDLEDSIQDNIDNDDPGSRRNLDRDLWDHIYGPDDPTNPIPVSFDDYSNSRNYDISFEVNNNSVGVGINFRF